MAFMENVMMASGTDWADIDQMSKLLVSVLNPSLCTCIA